jgi:hypothetical protein
LQLCVSTRAMAPDGVSEDHPLPVQVVDIRVSRNYGRTTLTILGWLLIASLGAGAAKYGYVLYDPLSSALAQLVK